MIFMATCCSFFGALKFFSVEKIDRGIFGMEPSRNFWNQGSVRASEIVILSNGLRTRIFEMKPLAS